MCMHMNYRQTVYSAEFQQPPDTVNLDQHEHLCQHRFQCSRNPQVMHPHICHHQHRHTVQNMHQHQYPCAHEVPCVHQIPSCLYQPDEVCGYKVESNKTGKRTKAERSRYSTSTKTLTNTRASNTTSSPSISMVTSSKVSRNVPTQPSVRRDSLTSTSNNKRASTWGSIYVPPPSSVSSLSPRFETKVPKLKVRNHTPENSSPLPARSVIHASTSASPRSTIQRPASKSTPQYAPPLAPIQTTPPKYATDRKSTQIASTPSQNTIMQDFVLFH
uniref:Uncharacterized protein n=1 Tax=Glossina pallidipes TaxID=7398 RepID=A0A1A9ZAG7_GLOPL